VKPNPFGEARPREEVLKERGPTVYRETEARPAFRPQFHDRPTTFQRREIQDEQPNRTGPNMDRRSSNEGRDCSRGSRDWDAPRGGAYDYDGGRGGSWRSGVGDYGAPCNRSGNGDFGGNGSSWRIDAMSQGELSALFSY